MRSGAAAADAAHCFGFSAADAAALLGVAAERVVPKTEEVYQRLWQCAYTTDDPEQGVSFSITVSESADAAIAEMAQYRSHLETAGETAPFKNALPAGAYSDIIGLADDAVWTDVNGTLTVRKGNVSMQFLLPKGKPAQVKAADAVLAKL